MIHSIATLGLHVNSGIYSTHVYVATLKDGNAADLRAKSRYIQYIKWLKPLALV